MNAIRNIMRLEILFYKFLRKNKILLNLKKKMKLINLIIQLKMKKN